MKRDKRQSRVVSSVTMKQTIVVLLAMLAVTGLSVIAQEPFPFQDIQTFRCEFLDGEGRQVFEGKETDRRGRSLFRPAHHRQRKLQIAVCKTR